ncbi:MAG: peptide chain release factor N(5)-glutamine methyltransferase [Bacteroidota bacterium]
MSKNGNTVSDLINAFNERLKEHYPLDEISGFIRWSFDYVCNFKPADLAIKRDETIDFNELERFNNIIERLKNQEPIQYILGETMFFGLRIMVNEHVLIPRPETEELVDWIIKENKNDNISIIDIGTGSGCIPIALKSKMGTSLKSVLAIDVSENALVLAKKNADMNAVSIDFRKVDILDDNAWHSLPLVDLIVSNPPYITKNEMVLMERNVLDHEPHLALFVDDGDALLFYKTILEFAKNKLNDGGKIYFEINESRGEELADFIRDNYHYQTIIKKDLSGKDRMLKVVKGLKS